MPVGAGELRLVRRWHEIHAEGLVMAMIADCWTCVDASWQYVPDGCSYLASCVSPYCMVPISPCGLMDIYDW